MGFGLSGSTTSTLMQGADVTIAYVDENEGPVAVDYFLSAYTQVGNNLSAQSDLPHTTIMPRVGVYSFIVIDVPCTAHTTSVPCVTHLYKTM